MVFSFLTLTNYVIIKNTQGALFEEVLLLLCSWKKVLTFLVKFSLLDFR